MPLCHLLPPLFAAVSWFSFSKFSALFAIDLTMRYYFLFLDGDMCTRAYVIAKIDLQNALQNMLRGALKSGIII